MIIDCYDSESAPIVQLEAFFGPKKHLVEKCLVLFSKVIHDHMLSMYDCRQIAELRACNGTIPVWAFTRNDEEIAFYLTPIGSAMAGGTLAEMSHLTGASKFIMFGSCGSLDRAQTDGRFILPTEAYRGEGLSYYFAAPADYIKIRNAAFLADLFRSWKIPFAEGRVWTTDSMLRETVNLVNRRRQEGCIAVEMELAGVQAVCDHYGYELYDFLAAGDVLAEDGYEIAALADANHNVDKLQIALRIAERV